MRARKKKHAAERIAAQNIANEPEIAREAQEKINFDLNRTVVPSRDNSKIRHIIAILNRYPDAVVTVTGFADRNNIASRNTTLSQERVEMVKMALSDAGISADRIVTNYYGDPSLVATDPDKARVVILSTE